MSYHSNSSNNLQYDQSASDTTVILESPEQSEPFNTKKAVIWGTGALLALIFLNKFKRTNVKELSQDQQDILLNAGAGDPGVLSLQPLDKSPLIFTTGSTSMNLTQLEAIISGYYTSYEATCARIASKLKTDASVVFDTVAMLFGELPAGKVVTEKSLAGYFQVLEIWSSRFDSALSVVSNAVSQILISQVSGLSTADRCTKWVYIRSNDISQSESTAKSAVITNINKINNGFLGIVGKTKTSTAETMNSSTVTQTYNEKISFVPHCEQYQLDPIVVMSILNSSAVSVALQYDLLSAVLAMAPKPANFLTNVPANVGQTNSIE